MLRAEIAGATITLIVLWVTSHRHRAQIRQVRAQIEEIREEQDIEYAMRRLKPRLAHNQ